jgi:asparagine synthase (glutamine-hydrolysing)
MQKYRKEPINTFTIGFKDSKFNEADKAEQIANYLGTKQRTFYVQENEILGLVKDLPICYDEPFADASALPSMLVSKYAKDYVSVVLTGDGGDENFYGYNHYEITSKIYKYSSWIPKKLRKILSELISSSAASQNRKLLLAKYLNYNDFSHLYNVVHSLYPELIHSNAKKNITYNKNNQYEFMQDWDFDNYLVDDILTKMDRASMYYSLEARSPLLDYRIMEFSRNISLDNHLDGNRKKSLLKDLLFKYIPANYYSENKQGFSVPLAYWLSTVLRKWALERLNEAKRDELIKSLIDINSVLDRFIKYPSVNDVQIWAICCYMDWKNRNDV